MVPYANGLTVKGGKMLDFWGGRVTNRLDLRKIEEGNHIVSGEVRVKEKSLRAKKKKCSGQNARLR